MKQTQGGICLDQNQNHAPISEQKMKSMLSSEAGKALAALLKADGGTALQQAAKSLKQGDTEAAKKILEPVISTPQAQQLLRRLISSEDTHNG